MPKYLWPCHLFSRSDVIIPLVAHSSPEFSQKIGVCRHLSLHYTPLYTGIIHQFSSSLCPAHEVLAHHFIHNSTHRWLHVCVRMCWLSRAGSSSVYLFIHSAVRDSTCKPELSAALSLNLSLWDVFHTRMFFWKASSGHPRLAPLISMWSGGTDCFIISLMGIFLCGIFNGCCVADSNLCSSSSIILCDLWSYRAFTAPSVWKSHPSLDPPWLFCITLSHCDNKALCILTVRRCIPWLSVVQPMGLQLRSAPVVICLWFTPMWFGIIGLFWSQWCSQMQSAGQQLLTVTPPFTEMNYFCTPWDISGCCAALQS